MAAYFNSQPIFGTAVTVATSDNPRSTQKTSFAGVSGVDVLDLGRHGRFSEIRGLVSGQDESSFLAAVSILRSYDDGQLYVLTVTLGGASVNWPYCKIESIEPTSKVINDPNQGYFQSFSIRIFHAL